MDKKKFITITAIATVLILCITIGYSVITTTLSINGSSRINSISWDVHFANVASNPNSTAGIKKHATKVDNLSIEYGIDLNLPGDFYEFTAVIKNGGSLDAKLASKPRFDDLTDDVEKMLKHSLTYEDGSAVEVGDVLKHGESRKIKVRIEFNDKYKFTGDSTEKINANLRYVMNYIQA